MQLVFGKNELGAMLGVGRESINRQFSKWSREGIIKVERGELYILNREALEDLVKIRLD